MPSRNIIRRDVGDGFYHVYARGASKKPIYLDEADRLRFLSLFTRYLSPLGNEDVNTAANNGRAYPNYYGQVRLVAYCLMGNHFHLLLWQAEKGNITAFMRCLMTSYARYFNLRHGQTGSLFESRYKASLIEEDAYLMHISRYIHLNPRSWKYYLYSSISFYRKGSEPDWLHTKPVLDYFSDRQDYMTFLYDYEDYKAMLDEIKYDLADK